MTPSTERDWVLQLFCRLRQHSTVDGQRDFVHAHPVLLSSEGLEMVLEALPDARATVVLLDQWRRHYWQHPEDYPRGTGPLDGVLAALRDRRMTLAEARATAVRPDVAGLLSNTYTRAVLDPLVRHAWDGSVFAPQAAELLLDAASAMPFVRLARHVRLGVVRGFVPIVHAALTRAPDGRLLARADDAASWALGVVTHRGARAELCHELGVTYLDAYTTDTHPSAAYSDAIAAWLARASEPMPAPVVALARARCLLAEAVELREPGPDRGTTFRALLQATIYEAFARGSAPDPRLLRVMAQGALQHLDAGGHAGERRWVEQALARFELA